MCCPTLWKSLSLIVVLAFVSVGVQQFANAFSPQDKQPESVQEPAAVAAEQESTQAADSEKRKQQIADLEEYLAGTKWVGSFSVRGKKALSTDEYHIVSAEKDDEGDQWVIVTRIKYNKRDVKVPIGIEIKWAGDTPVITAQDLTIPFMGTFNARVLIDEGQYAGTWAHGEVGGHMFGTITKLTDEELNATKSKREARSKKDAAPKTESDEGK